MRKILMQMTLLLLTLCLCVSAAGAETVRGNLEGRFDDILRIEYEGETYSLRGRLTTVLAMAVSTNEQGAQRADFARVLVIDDKGKTFSMIDIPENALIQVPSDVEGEFWNMRFADAYALEGEPNERCARLVAAINKMLGYDLIESHIAFDLEGIKVLNGGQDVEGTTREKLSVLKGLVEGMSTDELNETYGKLGDYIITEMKSGAVMKIVDKADRYERVPTNPFPGAPVEVEGYGPIRIANAEELQKLMVQLFFEENVW